ncbi:DegT/DnrJ/EryC1/StrS family aminotransferase [Aeromicrobium ginsengisoli]|uniref:DegT/DnrJ/EryC1/StrS family aminotransferase n=1 Tax=Aeromicrobium ginsengisoli TaxID=363867 RepID=A0A5M4FG11_9ACTN|nr:DegT/DnrJ/EryC1/StrS family aminotransferase [Aeromicrobium ginsengisoli]KAA1397723.1 DegT/DnrJ/EryC1/StrS family aminotransferase [Aeromicrobium ginsengisoli]
MSAGVAAMAPIPVPPFGSVPFLDLGTTTAVVATEVRVGWEKVIASNRFVGGEEVKTFEDEWAEYCGTEYAVGVGNGTDALVLALRALELGPGDEIIVPANTFVATVEAIVLVGATPRFVDVALDTGLMGAAEVEAAVSDRTRAIIAVHLFGQLTDMDALGRCATQHGLVLIEDAAQAHGATWRGIRAGSFGAVGCFSFYPGKNLGAFGDAGAVVTSDEGIAERIRSMRDHGRPGGAEDRHYNHVRIGTNSRLDTVQAVTLSAKLRHLDHWNADRHRVARLYAEELPSTAVPLRQLEHSHSAYHLMVVRVPDRDRVRAELAALGIGSGIHYPTPCHQLEPYLHWSPGELPNVETLAGQILSLPMYPSLPDTDVLRVCEALSHITADLEPFGDRPGE